MGQADQANRPRDVAIYAHSLEHERGLLGAVLANPARLDEAVGVVRPSDFHRPEHMRLWRLLLQMRAEDAPIDLITLPERVVASGKPDQFGGVTYVVELADHVPATAAAGHYAATIRDYADRRRTAEALQAAIEQLDPRFGNPATKVAASVAAELLAVGGDTSRTWRPIGDAMKEALEVIEARAEAGGGTPGISTGLDEIDRLLGGLEPSKLYILAARPAMGKSALGMQIAEEVALGGATVGVISLEMATVQIAERTLCGRAGVSLHDARFGNVDVATLDLLRAWRDDLAGLPIFVDDAADQSIADVAAAARQLAQRAERRGRPLGLLVVDYLQLLEGDASVGRVEQVSQMSRGLKKLAKALGVPVLALSQLSRSVEQRADKRPQLSDLRDSGSIEQDADAVLFIYRDEYYHPDTTQKPGIAEVIVAKNRAGQTGAVELAWTGHLTRFASNDDGLSL